MKITPEINALVESLDEEGLKALLGAVNKKLAGLRDETHGVIGQTIPLEAASDDETDGNGELYPGQYAVEGVFSRDDDGTLRGRKDDPKVRH